MIIPRPIYLDHILSHLNRGMILILTGQRRVGKSCLLMQLEAWLKDNREKSNVIYINKELQEFRHIDTAEALYECSSSQMSGEKENYLLIDEVQDIPDYENALRSLHAERRCQIVATGSNAYIFASELHTRLSGRYIEIPVRSLTYREFLVFHRLIDSDESLWKYLKVGGLPGLRNYNIDVEKPVREYLFGVFSTVMMLDVINRENIRNSSFLSNLANFIADNIGKIISVRSISNFVKSQGEKVSETMVSDYLEFLCGALLIDEVSRYDIHGKHLFEKLHKYYFTDHGLRNMLTGFDVRGSIEKIMENVVYNELLTQGFRVTVGVLRAGEVDFVATKGSQRVYIQVSYLIASEETEKREFGNLAAIRDNYPKYVVSMDPVGGELPMYPGVKLIPLRQFLGSDLMC